MLLDFTIETHKELVFNNIMKYLALQNIKVDKKDDTRPWGGFFVIDESDS